MDKILEKNSKHTVFNSKKRQLWILKKENNRIKNNRMEDNRLEDNVLKNNRF